MNIKIRAIGRTTGLFAIATVVPLAILELFQLEPDTLFALFLCSFIAWMFWVVYHINLTHLESKERVKEMNEKRQHMIAGMVSED